MNFKVGEFDPSDFTLLHKAFVEAFSDYFVSFQPTIDQFERRIIDKLHIHPSLSKLAWVNGQIVGFGLHTLNSYEGLKTLYNGGTGVIPSLRLNRIAFGLLDHVAKQASEMKTERILLEVIDKNDAGINLYKSLNYEERRIVKCFRLSEKVKSDLKIDFLLSSALKPEYSTLTSFEPTFLDCTDQLKYNLKNEIILEAVIDGALVGFAIFQPRLGRISQIAVDENQRGNGIGRSILQKVQKLSSVKDLTIMNIPENEVDTILALKSIGFQNDVNQIEMELKL